MPATTLPSRDLARRAVIEVAQLPENELLVVIEVVNDLKKRRERPHRESAKQLVALAKQRAAEMGNVPRAELAKRLVKVIDEIRAEAIAKGTDIEGEWESD